ncbi:MAG: TIGR02646 family protein [bacterium]|nr:TIGR02646 family protein [bacterium]
MLKIKKADAPDFFASWIKNKPEYGARLREFILDSEQAGMCCYCEKGVSPRNQSSHLEHVRPQDTFPKLKHDYKNLVVSCQTEGRCGKAKGNRFSRDFIVPTEEEPGDYLAYSPNGEIKAIDDNAKAIETIRILKLNVLSLVKARRALFLQLDAMNESVEEFEIYFTEFTTFVNYYKENF